MTKLKQLSDDPVEQAIVEADATRIIEAGEQELAEADGVRIAEAKYTEDRDLANQLLGQAQMASSFSKICALSALLKLRFVKENKLYRDIRTADGQQFTWALYCGKLEVSHKTVDEQLLNLNVLGEEAFGSLQQMGVGSRELRKLRKLPEDDRQLIIESQAIEVGDKEAVQEFIEELIAKKDQEKESILQREENLKATIQANSAVSESKNKRLDELATENLKLHGFAIPWDKCVGLLKNEMTAVGNNLDQSFSELLIMHDAILNVDFAKPDDKDLARRSLVIHHKSILDRTAMLVAELQHKYEMELCGYVGVIDELVMQDPEQTETTGTVQ